MFKTATRKKYRYSSTKGQLTTEQLWDLPLTSKAGPSLDKVAIGLSIELKDAGTISFVDDKTPANTLLEAKLDVVLEIIKTKKAENAARLAAKSNKEQKEKLLAIKAQRADKALLETSDADLDAMIAKL